MTVRPEKWGMYEPQTEHDSCGIGFVVHMKGDRSRQIVESGLEILHRMTHRSACGCDPETGDGAGIQIQIPHGFFELEANRLGFELPRRRRYGVGQVFFPNDPKLVAEIQAVFEEAIQEQGQRLITWRDVPVDPSKCGTIARQSLPTIKQVFIGARRVVPSAFDRTLFIIRRLTELRVAERGLDPDGRFHVASLSSETMVYKGLLLPEQLPTFYQDLSNSELTSAMALVHSRFSTNTFPTWDLAQPFRFMCHNGEINTVQGNRNWMAARTNQLRSGLFGGNIDRLSPIIVPGKSDSAQFDNMLELLYLGGRSLPHAMMLLIPEAWENNMLMDVERRAFYRYASSLMEPWDGPAAIAFTDGHLIGATLDRNGLRPARYLVTDDDIVVLASETGVYDVPASRIRTKGRLQPGRMFLVDTDEGRIIDDVEVKREIARRRRYDRWLAKNVFRLSDLPSVDDPVRFEDSDLNQQQRAFGYSDEDIRVVIAPMAQMGSEPTGSMGNDTPLAVLSERDPSLFNYFHQLFAQVTNPPIDPIRESMVMTLHTAIGGGGNTFEETPEQCHRLEMSGPVLSNAELAKLKQLKEGLFDPITLEMHFPVSAGPEGLEGAVEALCDAAVEAFVEGGNILILTDRGVGPDSCPIPALLAVSAVHQRLVREGIRLEGGLVVETAEVREVHQFALLIGYGAAAINPYLALDTIASLVEAGDIDGSVQDAQKNFAKAVNKGLLKVMSKMGISTLASYRGAQIFECIGLNQDLIQEHFTGTPSRLEGIGLVELGREALNRHERGFSEDLDLVGDLLPISGEYQWRRRGERHKWNPSTIAKLQASCRLGSKTLYNEYSELVSNEDDGLVTIRGMLEFDYSKATPIALEEVEPVSEIVKRFCTGAMSFGSISAEAHATLAIAMNRLGGKSNTGEGGEEAERFKPMKNGDSKRSAIKQVASGRFGVTCEYLVNADELQIKMAQGAKPGEGGQLPGHKVSERIARVRCSTPGVTLISPPPHHDIYSIEDLAQLISDLYTVNPEARVSVKLVSEVGVGTIAAGVAKARAGAVIIAGGSGGTGASPISSIKHAGLPWELGLPETQQVLVQNDLRDRIRVQVDGGFRTGRDVVLGALLGADEFGFATAALIVEGCIMLRKCHLNTCSVGIATQDESLRKRFKGNPDHVVNYFLFVAEEIREYMARLGFRTVDEMVGHVEYVKTKEQSHWKTNKLDLSPILAKPRPGPSGEVSLHCKEGQRLDLSDHIDNEILRLSRDIVDGGYAKEIGLQIENTDRAVGAMLSGAIARRFGAHGLVDDTLRVRFTGSAGQSFGAFLAKGITFTLQGDANDYVGKGLCGGRLVVAPMQESRFVPEDNILIGNTVLYGATSGEAFFRGVAGERFAVRNSGARAVVEGVGDHGCEYMTGGVVVVLGPTGRNFAAGMSGGVAFVFDRDRDFRNKCNLGMVELESMATESDMWIVRRLIRDHVRYTNSTLGMRILDNWDAIKARFVKIMPTDYKRVLEERRKRGETIELSPVPDAPSSLFPTIQ